MAGFDILYACQDLAFDRNQGLFSIPARVGIKTSFLLARGMHAIAFATLLVPAWLFHLSPTAFAGMLIVGALLTYEHLLVSPQDSSKMNAAFFMRNGVISFVFFVFVAFALLLRHP